MATLTAVFKVVDEMSGLLDRLVRAGETVVQKYNTIETAANSAFSTAATASSYASSELDDYESELINAHRAVEDLSRASASFEATLAQQSDATKKAEEELEQYGNTSENAGDQSKKFGKASTEAIQELSRVLAAAGVVKALQAVYQSFEAAVEAAIKFESAVTGVYKTVDGTSDQLRQISADIKAMSTTMPASAVEIAAVAEAAGQLGIATDDITSFTRVMIDLGEATNLTADTAATSLAKFSNITGMAASNYESLGSTVVALGNNFATTEADIVAMSTRMASAGTLAGLTEPEILALAAAMSSVGIEADAGGSAMSKLLVDMQVAVETGSARLEEFAAVAGMTGAQFADVFGRQSSEALYSFIAGLNDVERNGATATVILEDMGITEVRLSNAVKSLANNHEGLNSALAVASSAWSENTALANEANLRYSTLESRIDMTKNASANLAAAIGDDLTPIIGEFVDTGRGALEWFTGLVEKYPAVTAGLTAVTVGVGLAVASLTVFSVVTSPMVVTAIKSITAAMSANPLFLAITGIVALTAATVAFVSVLTSQKSEYETWTASTKAQHDQLQALNAEYETAKEVYGETSREALALRYEVDELTVAFDENKMTIEELVAQNEKVIATHNQLTTQYSEATGKIRDEEQGTLALIQRLELLGTKTNATAFEQEQMKEIIKQLNQAMPDLALSYEDVTNSLDSTIKSMQELAREQANQELHEESLRTYVDLLKDQSNLEKQIADTEAELNIERERQKRFYDDSTQAWVDVAYTQGSPWVLWTNDLDTYNAELDKLQMAYEENRRTLEDITDEFGAMSKAARGVYISSEEAVSSLIKGIQGDMDTLIEKYDDVYGAARSSIDGVIGLFDTMKTETALSIDDMTAALQSQSEYLTLYAENLRKAAEFGLDDGLIASLSDGSAESAGYLDALVRQVERLGSGSEAAAEFVDGFNAKFTEVDQAKDQFASTVADMQGGFTTALEEMEAKLLESIDNMNMETEAAAAAADTIRAYIDSIKSHQRDAVSAAEAVANATAAALSRSASAPTRGYAVGTSSAASGLALVGEDGPELVNFRGGESVYTAPETERLLAESASRAIFAPPPPDNIAGMPSGSTDKRILIDINGSGELNIAGVDEETVWDMVSPKLKDAFMGIVRAEIFEEGDRAYAF